MSRCRTLLTRWSGRRLAVGAFAALVLVFSATAVVTRPGSAPATSGPDWYGGSGSPTHFSDDFNWDVQAPVNGDAVTFGASGFDYLPVNDINGLRLATITFNGSNPYTVSGLAIGVDGPTGSIVNSSTVAQTISAPIDFGGAAEVVGGGAGLTFSGAVTGSGTVTQLSGTVAALGSSLPDWAVTTGTLRTGAAISGSGGLSVAAGGTVQPGGTGTGTVSLAGALALAGNTAINVSGASADRITANGATVGGTLAVTVGTTPANGASFTIVDNTSGAPIGGTFSGLPEGSVIVGHRRSGSATSAATATT